MTTWIEINLPWEDPAARNGVTPPLPRPDTSDFERQFLDGMSCKEAYAASSEKYNVYCRAKGVDTRWDNNEYTDPKDEGQKAQLLAHQTRCGEIRAVGGGGLAAETPQFVAWKQAYEEAAEAARRRSFKNHLRVGMGFQTEDGRYFLVGNMDVSGDEGGCCAIDTITPETRIVRYCMVDLPFDVTSA